ncbi:DUF3017 domain-containing protein [Brachybacterium sp. DNPG3]
MPRPLSPFTRRAALRRQRVLTLGLIALGAIVVLGAVGPTPLAGAALAGLLGALALLRLVLPTRSVGALAVRSRGVDVCVLGLLAVGIAVLSGAPNL